GVGRDACGRGRGAGLGGAEELFRRAAELVEVGVVREGRHDVSLPACGPRARPEENVTAPCVVLERWTQSCPRTRRRPHTPTRTVAMPGRGELGLGVEAYDRSGLMRLRL